MPFKQWDGQCFRFVEDASSSVWAGDSYREIQSLLKKTYGFQENNNFGDLVAGMFLNSYTFNEAEELAKKVSPRATKEAKKVSPRATKEAIPGLLRLAIEWQEGDLRTARMALLAQQAGEGVKNVNMVGSGREPRRCRC